MNSTVPEPQIDFPALGQSGADRALSPLLLAVWLQLLGLSGLVLQRGGPTEAAYVDPVLVALCLGLAAGLLAPSTRRAAAWLVPLPFFALPLHAALTNETLAGQLALTSSAVRYLAPLALALSLTSHRRTLGAVAVNLLRVGIALTFIGHGVKALFVHPHFVELIQESAAHLLQWRPSAAQCAYALRTIGVFDIAAGVLTLFVGLRAALLYMAIWGALTAFSRISYDGWYRFPDVLFRATHFLVPWILYRAQRAGS